MTSGSYFQSRSYSICLQQTTEVRPTIFKSYLVNPTSYLFLGFYHFAAAQAGRAHTNALGRASNLRAHWAQVDVPTSLTDIVRVADIVPELRPLAADITYLCHWTAFSRKFQN